MRTSIKYGLLITAAIATWVILKHAVIKQALPPALDLVVFNGFELIGIVLGVRERRAALSGLSFGQGMKTGIGIAGVYALTACAFFAGMYLVVGPTLLQKAQEPGVGERSTATVLAGAFTGLFIGAMLSGAVLSALVSAVLRRSGPTRASPT